MESSSSSSSWEYTAVMNELIQGMEKAKQLRFHLCLTSPSESHTLLLLQRVLSSFEKALMVLKWKATSVSATATAPPPESSLSVDPVSPGSDEFNKRDHHHHNYDHGTLSKKRKLQPTWTEQVKVNSENGLEGPVDDGYSWRKYGQKDILGAKFPRSYYRCTYRAVQNCWATKQVQRSDDDPMVFEVTYKGAHACNHLANGAPLPTSPDKQPLEHQNGTLTNFKTNLRVSTENLEQNAFETVFTFPSTMTYACGEIDNHSYFPAAVNNVVDEHHLGAYLNSPLFLSPATSESNYFSPATYQKRNLSETAHYQHSECDATEIISTRASTTNSPIAGIEFPIDLTELDPNFPFNTAGFFS